MGFYGFLLWEKRKKKAGIGSPDPAKVSLNIEIG